MKKTKIISIILVAVFALSMVFVFAGCTPKIYNVSVADGITGGKIEIDKTSGEKGSEITVTVTPEDGYRLATGGLTYSSSKFGVNYASGNALYGQQTIKVPVLQEDTVIDAEFEKIPAEGDYIKDKVIGVYKDVDGNNVEVKKDVYYMGTYPQSLKNADVTIDGSADANGYYTGSDGNKYAKVTVDKDSHAFMASGIEVKFSNGADVNQYPEGTKKKKAENIVATDYYFMVEPIAWIVLTDSEGKKTLMSSLILDNQAFLELDHMSENKGISDKYNIKASPDSKDFYASNYEQSDIREFLNNTFYNQAFSADNSIIEVENNNSTTASADNENLKYAQAQKNTVDKVYMLSADDIFNGELGFQTNDDYVNRLIDPMKLAFTTDYARANGAWTNAKAGETNYYGMGYWWTRSNGNSSYYITVLNSKSNVNNGGLPVYKDMVGVRPVVTVEGINA